MAKKTKKVTKRIDALSKARERYTDGNSCGDTVAKALECFRTPEGLNIDKLTACLKNNDCAVPKVDMKKHGAVGRFRMVAGLMLRAAARKRAVKIGGRTFGEKWSRKTVEAQPQGEGGRCGDIENHP